MVETVPVVDQAKVALREVVQPPGLLVSVTAGAAVLVVELEIVQLYVALELPYELETVTRNVCEPGASPL